MNFLGVALSLSDEPSIEETSEDLDQNVRSQEEMEAVRRRWERAERDLVTQVIDFNIDSIVRFIDEETLDLNAVYQRRDRWELSRKSRLIESFLLNIPVPSIYLNENPDRTYSVIDGKQRLSAIYGFIKGEYPLQGLEVFYEAEGLRFDDLDLTLQRSLSVRASLRAVILLNISDPTIQYDVFHRLNTGGISLNAQEVRNNAYRGPLNDLLNELSEHPQFHNALGIHDKRESSIWRQMRDVELVLRFFALQQANTHRRMSNFDMLNEYMQRSAHLDAGELTKLRESFLSTLDKAQVAFGSLLFRRWDPRTDRIPQMISVAVYDAQMLAIKEFDLSEIASHAREIEQGMRELFLHRDFALPGGTVNRPGITHERVHLIHSMVRRALGR
ncbi:DUF262 domain-containing protein [Planotetraspora mira]|uniref:GmrSD restriction endonucleases N-terminal domain-containing protein n=1 Tax=Planotetraspora mira TaxID=58121 RepID=A0A8J3TXJ0_9ACTN|nr:DUF262 domain-containing protein [Planotetraspora mira]GII32309.1 hypothetical protein Pmi06nite_57510 [Planotetraspora mira]